MKKKLSILMCCHLPLDPKLGGAKVYIEAAECYRQLGHMVDLFGVDELCPPGSPFMNEWWRVNHFPAILKEFIIKNADYDVVEFEAVYLPFSMPEIKSIMVARSVLLELHFKEITLPRFKGVRGFMGQLLKSWSRNQKINYKIQQTLKTITHADFVNVPSLDDKNILMKQGIPEYKIIVQPYGIFSEKWASFEQIRIKQTEETYYKKIAFVGTFDSRKGAVEFPYIVTKLLSKNTYLKFKLLGVIAMFPDESAIINFLGLKHKNKIEIVGKFQPDQLPALLQDCTIGIFPSYLESFGFGALEMMAMGLPVVGYSSPGISSLLIDELKVTQGDAAHLIEKCHKLLNDSEFYQKCRTECVKKAEKYIYEKQSNQSIQCYLNEMSNQCHK